MIRNMPDNVKSEPEAPEAAITVPRALLFYTDLMFGVQLQNMARKAGYQAVTLKPDGTEFEGAVLVVDMGARGDWESAIRAAHSRGIPVIAFGSHMDAEARRRARQAGVARVLANSNLARDLPGILRDLNARGNPGRTADTDTGDEKDYESEM
jgi:hypothetical protein